MIPHEAVRLNCRTWLEAPDLFAQITEDIGLLGVAGEKELAETIYLRLVKLIPAKVDAEIVTWWIEQNSPIAFVESTTLRG